MTITNPNTGTAVWSRLAEDITVTGLSTSSPVTIAVYLNSNSVASFNLTPHPTSGSVVIRFGEILEAILPHVSVSIPSTTASYTNPVFIRVTQGNTSQDTTTMFCFRGGTDSLYNAIYTSRWLTWKPQVVRTYPWAKEVISFIKPKSTSRTVSAKVYLSTGSSVTVTLGTFSSSSTQVSICTVNCSLSRIQGFSSVSGQTVLAYDVYWSSSMPAQRFIVKPTRTRQREFFFTNSFGVPDTVFSTGDVSRETDSEVATALINTLEKELYNSAVERFKVQTGGLRKRREMDHWQDFFRSEDRWVFLQGETQIRRIVVDSIDSDMVEYKLSGASFTYHHATRFTGRYYEDTELPAYTYSELD